MQFYKEYVRGRDKIVCTEEIITVYFQINLVKSLTTLSTLQSNV